MIIKIRIFPVGILFSLLKRTKKQLRNEISVSFHKDATISELRQKLAYSEQARKKMEIRNLNSRQRRSIIYRHRKAWYYYK